MRVGLVQQACSEDREENLSGSRAGLEAAVREGAELVLLQELHTSLYFCAREETAAFDLAEAVPGPTTEILSAWAREFSVVLVGSVFERRAAGIYHNTAVVFERDGRFAGRYRKAHIPDDPGYSEKFYFTPGDTGFEPIDTSVGRLGVLVCWDQWFPEAARLMSLAGAELLLYPTAIGFDPNDDPTEQQRQLDAWMTVQRGHAVANGLPLLACNRIGIEGDARFWGHSFACGPQGEILAEAGEDAQVLVTDIDLGRSEKVRRIWPFLRDRRVDAYAEILKRFRDD